MRKLTILTFAALALLVPAEGALAQEGAIDRRCEAGGGYEVCFSNPKGTNQGEGVIFTRLRQMVNQAEAGDEIRVAMFSWTSAGEGVTRALGRAAKKGADVKVIVGNGTSKRQRTLLRDRGVGVQRCVTACISRQRGSINHVKLFLLRLKGRKHTILTSSNLTTPQREKLYNDSVRSAQDDALYDFYRAYWDRLQARDWQGWTNEQRGVITPSGTLGLVFPRTDDPVATALASVQACPTGNAKVWVAMAIFTSKRQAINAQLRRLQGLGCNVRLVIGNNVKRSIAGAGLPDSKVRRAPVHHKFMVLDAVIAGKARQITFTGSENFTGSARELNDEIWAGYTAPLVTTAYARHFDGLYDRAQPAQ